MGKLDTLIKNLERQGIDVSREKPTDYFLTNSMSGAVSWEPFVANVKITMDDIKMSLASMAAVQLLDVEDSHGVLDACAAPGMKSMYLKRISPSCAVYCNDVSSVRVARMKRLHADNSIEAEYRVGDATTLSEHLNGRLFDRVLVDAPCSGEGVILGGDESMLETWSTAKINRLQQLQIRIVKDVWRLLRPGGLMVYSTCTLNKNENERVLKKALKLDISPLQAPLNVNELPKPTAPVWAWRILPSRESIGFFVAVIKKQEEQED